MSKVILITGDNTGIGLSLGRLLAEKKHTVYITARNEASGKEALQSLHSDGLTSTKFVLLDVTKADTIEAAQETVESAEGHLDVLVNNAGISMLGHNQDAATASIDGLRGAMETNFYGTVRTTTAFLTLLRKSANLVILNISSELGSNKLQSRPESTHHFVAYNASKAALNSYTIALAHDLAPEGVRVNAVTPGYTATKMTDFTPHARSSKEAAEVALLPWVLIGKDGPTGKFFAPNGTEESPW